MTYSLHRVRDWSYQQLAPYNSALTKAMRKIVDHFPDDVSLNKLASTIATGDVDLWLILDEENKFLAFLTTEMETAISGKKRLLLLELAGEGSLDLTQVLPKLEAFAKQEGAEEICPYGRLGWKKALSKYGYQIATIKYVKELTNGR